MLIGNCRPPTLKNCVYCQERFCSYSYGEHVCNKCSKAKKLLETWSELDELIAFYEGQEAYELVLRFRNYKNGQAYKL